MAGVCNEVAVRVYNPSGKGGFLSEAPFLMTYFLECVFEGEWEFLAGDAKSPFEGVLKTRPASSSFDEFRESNRVLGKAEMFIHGQKLSKLPPEESFRKMKAADDLVVELMLAEPRVAQPTHFSFDSRGRLWVSQYRQYPYPVGLKMVSRDRYFRSHYDKVPPAPPHHDRGQDVISIHEDTTGDGRYDITKDARTLSGFLTDQDTQVVALRGMAGEDTRVERQQVESIEPMGRSLMPERLLEGLSDQELRDFFAFLRISQPISR